MIRPREVHYPESDGQPVAETEWHFDVLRDLVDVVKGHLDDLGGWHVAGNQLFYHEQGNPRASFSPDVYAIRGIPQEPRRRIWKLWEEPEAVPALVVELSSASSHVADVQRKRALYERLGVQEYVVFDVLREGPAPWLRMWHRVGDRFVEQSGPQLVSPLLCGARWQADEWRLRLIDATGEPVPTPSERAAAQERRAAAATERANAEADRANDEADRAQAQADRAQAQAHRAAAATERAKAEADRAAAATELANDEAHRADAEADRADAEARRADEAQARVRALEAQLERLRSGDPER